MVSLIFGIAFVAASLFYFALKLHVAYGVGFSPESAGGVPTLDGVLFPPAFCAWGICFGAGATEATRLSIWVCGAIWLFLTLAAAVAMSAAAAAGRRRREKGR
ncbi:MAG: hypothetical protein ACE5GS_10465 [Kiloniellaceae bacterium]